MKKLLIGTSLLLIDRFTKGLALNGVVQMSRNTGLLVGGVKQNTLIVISFLIIFFLTGRLMISFRKKDLSLGWLLIILGGFSNLFDRVIYGYVIDMIPLFSFSVFNVADVMIVLGVVLLI